MTQRDKLLALIDKIQRIQDAQVRAYLNNKLLEQLFSLDSPLAMRRPLPQETMVTTNAIERSILQRELNNLSSGLGDDLDAVEQMALLKALFAKRRMEQGLPVTDLDLNTILQHWGGQ